MTFNLGACCVCGQEKVDVRNFIPLPYQAPQLGTGWCCFQCNLPPDGATAVVCDDCLGEEPIWVIDGRPAHGQRRLLTDLVLKPFHHNLRHHPEIWPANNPEAELVRFEDSPDVGPDCLCSWCGQPILDLPLRLWDERGREYRLHATCVHNC